MASVAAPSQGAQPSFNPGLTYQPRHQYIPRPRLDSSPGGHHGSYFRPRHHRFQPRFPPNSTVADDGSISYDGKRMRKAIHRKTVDYNPSVFKYLQNRVWQRDRRDEHQIQPDALYLSDLLPPTALIEKPMNCVTTKFVRTSTNKFRCPVFCLSWTPEGRRLVTGASSGEFTLWNGLTFNFETILQAHETAVRAMQWSHSDTWMITADHAGYIKYWQSNMNNVKMYQAHKEPIRGISFCPSDSKFASCSDDGSVRVWDFMRCHEERVLRGHGADVRCVDWHPQKGLIASGSKDNQQPIKLWDPRSGNSLATMHAHKHTVMDLKWHKNGTWLLTASRDHLVKLFDIRKLKEEMQTFKGHKREATAVAWHPIHEGLFASGSADGALMFWMVGCDHEVGSMEEAHEGMIWDLAWHPLGHILASGSNDHSTKFWTRNRPGDKMRDKYNLNNLPQGMMETEMLEYSTAEPSAMPSLPGMGLEHGLPDHLIKDEDRDKEETNELPSIPGLDWEADEAFLKAEERAALKKVPYSRPVPKVFEQAWSGEIDLEAMKKEQQDKEQIQKKIQAQLNMKKNQPNLLLAAQQMLGALAGSLRQHLSVSEATRMLIPGPPIMMRPQGPRVILAPGQSVMRPPPPNQMVFVPGGPGQKNSNGDPNSGGMPENASDSSSSNQHQGPGSQGQMRLLGSARPPGPHGPMGGPQMGPQGDPQNQMGPPGGPQNQFGPPGGPQRQMGGPQNQMGPPGGSHNQMGGPQRQMGGPQNQLGPQGGPQNQMGPPGGPQNQFGPQGGQNQMGGPQNQMGGPQNQMGGPQNQMGGPQNQMGGPQNQMGGPQNQMGGPQNQMGGPQNQMGGPQNQMGGPQTQMGGPQNQMGGPQNQMGGPQNQMGGPQNQMGGPQNQMGGPQNQMGGPQNQMGGPQNQMGGPQDQFQHQMGGPWGEMEDGQTQDFGHGGPNQFGGPQGQMGNQWNQGQYQMGGPPEGQHDPDMDKDDRMGSQRNAPFSGPGQPGGMLEGGQGTDEDFRGSGGYDGGMNQMGGDDQSYMDEDQDYRHMGGRNDRGGGGGGHRSGGHQHQQQRGEEPYQRGGPNQRRHDGGGFGGAYDGDEEYDSRYQNNRHRGRGGGGGGGGRGSGRGKGDGYRGRGRGRGGGQNDDGEWDDEGQGHEDQEQWRNDYEDDYDEGGYGRHDDQGSGAKRGRKRQWGDEGPGGGPGNRGRGRGGGGRGRSRGGRGSSHRGNRGAGRGGRGWGRGGERGGGGRGRARGGY